MDVFSFQFDLTKKDRADEFFKQIKEHYQYEQRFTENDNVDWSYFEFVLGSLDSCKVNFNYGKMDCIVYLDFTFNYNAMLYKETLKDIAIISGTFLKSTKVVNESDCDVKTVIENTEKEMIKRVNEIFELKLDDVERYDEKDDDDKNKKKLYYSH